MSLERDADGYSRLFEDVVRRAYGMKPMTDRQCQEAIKRNEQFRKDIDDIRRKQRCAGSGLQNLILD